MGVMGTEELEHILKERGYKKHLKQNELLAKGSVLWQKKIDGFPVNFWFYPQLASFRCNMVDAEVSYKVVGGLWGQVLLYGLGAEELKTRIPEIEARLVGLVKYSLAQNDNFANMR